MTDMLVGDKQPTPDPAEQNAFFPSTYSLSQFTSRKSDLAGADYPAPYREVRWKILLIGADERYLPTDNGTLFSTGNHPVETLLPMYHLDKAGFAFDVATLSGNPVKFEWWAIGGGCQAMKLSSSPASALQVAVALEGCQRLEEIQQLVRAFAIPLGYHRFALFSISASEEGWLSTSTGWRGSGWRSAC